MTARVASCLLLIAGWVGLSAGPAVAGWSAARTIEKGVDPMVAFGPSGTAAIRSSQLNHSSEVSATFLARRLPHRRFEPPQRFARVPDANGRCGDVLRAIALPSDGATVALFGPPRFVDCFGPINAFVEPAGARRFGAAQRIVKLGDPAVDGREAYTTTVVDTTRGEVVEAGFDDSGSLSTATLARGSARFVVAPGGTTVDLPGFESGTLATDDAGGTFLTGDDAVTAHSALRCTVVTYRPPGGRFITGYQSTDCGGGTSYTPQNLVEGIAATGDGYAALLTTDAYPELSKNLVPDPLLVQVGRFGGFGAPDVLSPAYDSAFGVATDRDGSATVAWLGSAFGRRAFGVYGEEGSVHTGFAGQPTLIGAYAPHVRLSGLLADGAVAAHRCAPHRHCTIVVALARPDRKLTRPQEITANGRRLLALQSDHRGDLILVWSNYRGVLYAATRASGDRRLSAPHRLSESGVNPGTVSAAFGPRGEAIVAWSQTGHTSASVYSSSAR